MTTIVIRPDQVAATLEGERLRVSEAIRMAIRGASWRLKTHLVQSTDAAGVVDTGIYKNSHHVLELPDGGAEVSNSAPYAGIIEMGARPHPVSQEGREAIKLWAMRKLGLTDQEAESASWGICKKIEREGQQGHFLFRDALPAARQYLDEEFRRIVSR